MVRVFRRYLAQLTMLSALFIGGCIENDIPYPYTELYVLNVEGDGFNSVKIGTSVNDSNVTIDLEETTDIRNVNITKFEYTDGASISRDMVGTFDMRSPMTTELYLYQSYTWTVTATQTIDRYVYMKGLLGSEIDPVTRTAKMYINDQLDMTQIEITDIRLAADVADLGYSPSYAMLTSETIDFSNGNVKYVDVTAHGRTNRWTLSVEPREATVDLEVGAWAKIAWLYAKGDMTDSDACHFYYRLKGDLTWIEVAPLSISGFEMEGKIVSLLPNTEYEFKATAGGVDSEITTATTEDTPLLPNGSFDDWSYDGTVWFPYIMLSDAWWSSGNEGSTTLNADDNTTTPLYDDDSNTTAVASLKSTTVMNIFAAGSIFTGSFGGISQGTSNAYIKFGRPFTSRPVALKGRVKYTPGSDVTGRDKYPQLPISDTDEGSIYIALGEWTAEEFGWSAKGDTAVGTMKGDEISPVVIETYQVPVGNTTAKYTVKFDSESHAVIAYGEQIYSMATDWTDLHIPLSYKDGEDGVRGKLRVPTHVIVVCSSSRYGDYFVGSKGSQMWIDDLELVYE